MDATPHHLRMRDPLELDDNTVDRLLDGMPVDDAPPRYRGVATLLRLLDAPPTAAELAREGRVMSALGHPTPSARYAAPVRRKSRRRTRRLQLTTAALVASTTLFVGLGAAGALPNGAQSVAHDVLGTIGVHAPSPDSTPDVSTEPHNTGSGSGASTSSDTPQPAADGQHGKGAAVSNLAHDNSLTGVEKGAAVSTLASDGQSHAGQQGNARDAQSNSGDDPAATPPSDNGPTDNAGNSSNMRGQGNNNGQGNGRNNGNGNGQGN